MTRAFIIQIPISSPDEIPSILAELIELLEPHFGDIKVDIWNSPDENQDVLKPTNFPTF